MSVAKRRSRSQLTTFSIRGFAFNPLLTHMGEVRCNMLTGALVPRWGTVAGVPGPRRSADDRDAGWFAPVATRRRPFYCGDVIACRWCVISPPRRGESASAGKTRRPQEVAREILLRKSAAYAGRDNLKARRELAPGLLPCLALPCLAACRRL